MQGGANPTLNVVFVLDEVGGSVQVYKNSILFTTLLSEGESVNVPVVAGDTFYVVVNSGGNASWVYYINGTFISNGTGFAIRTSPTYTVSGTNAYLMEGYTTST